MSLSLTGSITAMAPGLTTSLQGVGGHLPYVYSLAPNGAGGSINASTGVYTAPATMNADPKFTTDTVIVTDFLGATASYPLLITNPLGLVCEIIQKEMALANGRVYLWDQKIQSPNDSGLFIAVSILSCKPFASNSIMDSSGSEIQTVNMLATLSLNAISRGPEARDRKEEIILALGSQYSQSQQELNSFNIGKLPPGGQFVNISEIDGAAIPYRFNISVNVQYFVKKVKAAPYFDDFADPSISTQP